MAEPIPAKPEDNLFPRDWPGMNEFARLFTVGGDFAVSHPKRLKDEDGEESQLVHCYHMDRGDKFHVTRMDPDTYIVRRLPRE